jgi:hypothetical protein
MSKLTIKDQEGSVSGTVVGIIIAVVVVLGLTAVVARNTAPTHVKTVSAPPQGGNNGGVTLTDDQFKALLAAQAGNTPPTTVQGATGGPAPTTTACNTKPGDLETLPKAFTTDAPRNQWVHLRYKSTGDVATTQFSWAHTFCFAEESGGKFLGFEGNDGRFVFRHSAQQAKLTFFDATSSKYKAQALGNKSNLPYALNIRALPDTPITILGEGGKVLGTQNASRAGDLTVILPDDGVTGFSLSENDPPATFEVQIWVGPYDRSDGIDTFDARKNR